MLIKGFYEKKIRLFYFQTFLFKNNKNRKIIFYNGK